MPGSRAGLATLCVATAAGTVIGAMLGYDAAGVGGAILYGAMLGAGGALLGSLLVRTGRVLRIVWPAALTVAVLVLAAWVSWGWRL